MTGFCFFGGGQEKGDQGDRLLILIRSFVRSGNGKECGRGGCEIGHAGPPTSLKCPMREGEREKEEKVLPTHFSDFGY